MNKLRLALLASLVFFIFISHSEAAKHRFGSFRQLLNPDDPTDHRTFKQRYLIHSKYAVGLDSPVIYFVGSEGSLETDRLDGYFTVELAKAIHAHVVVLEHRFYGKSQPFRLLTVENMKYLSMHHALQDLARFEEHVIKHKKFSGKWIVVGGSYGGNLAAFYRQKYPHLVVGAIASSAAPHFPLYWSAVDHFAARLAGPECLNMIRSKVYAPLEAALQDSQVMQRYKTLFEAQGIDGDIGFLSYIGGEATWFGQYDGGIQQLCAAVKTETPMESFAKAMNDFNHRMGLKPGSSVDLSNPNASYWSGGVGVRQWDYQRCTELGYWVIPDSDPNQSLYPGPAQAADLYGYENTCKVFGITQAPAIDNSLRDYYFPLLDPSTSNILFTIGSTDPVSTLGISKENGNATNPNTLSYTIEGGMHCSDMHKPLKSDSQALKKARAFEFGVVSGWVQ